MAARRFCAGNVSWRNFFLRSLPKIVHYANLVQSQPVLNQMLLTIRTFANLEKYYLNIPLRAAFYNYRQWRGQEVITPRDIQLANMMISQRRVC